MEITLREASENYLETILRLEDENRSVRSIDVATAMEVSRPSVNKAIGVLKKAEMVEQQPYGRIILTEKGRCKAMEVTHRHKLLKGFLINILKVEEPTADNEACRMEHVISDDTLNKLAKFVESLSSAEEK
ncbi:metal-dependent transcriptional regulator [Oscillospiraceae bacterium MB08-C2-2]|nr:metal-dependent transcriptional regulator [Oscillospiraceae bacterium MB08-C2-2]